MRTEHWMVTAARERQQREREEAEKYRRIYYAVSGLKVWTNEDGRRFVFEDDLCEALEIPGFVKEAS